MQEAEQNARYEKWQAIITEQEASGLSQTQFCKERNISSAQFGYYRSVLKPKQKETEKAVFSPVKIKQKNANNIRLTLPNGFQCEFDPELPVSHIKELIKVLLSC